MSFIFYVVFFVFTLVFPESVCEGSSFLKNFFIVGSGCALHLDFIFFPSCVRHVRARVRARDFVRARVREAVACKS